MDEFIAIMLGTIFVLMGIFIYVVCRISSDTEELEEQMRKEDEE